MMHCFNDWGMKHALLSESGLELQAYLWLVVSGPFGVLLPHVHLGFPQV